MSGPNMTESIADYRARGMTKYRAFDQWVIDTGLRPGINTKDFYAVFETIRTQTKKPELPSGFCPTHRDQLNNKLVQITVDENGIYKLVWEDGHTGSNPSSIPPEPDRFILIQEADKVTQ